MERARLRNLDARNIACINSIGGMIVTGNCTISARATRAGRAIVVTPLGQIWCFGTLLREAAAIAFAIRCKVIDGR